MEIMTWVEVFSGLCDCFDVELDFDQLLKQFFVTE